VLLLNLLVSVAAQEVHCDPNAQPQQVCPDGTPCARDRLQCTPDYCVCGGSPGPSGGRNITVVNNCGYLISVGVFVREANIPENGGFELGAGGVRSFSVSSRAQSARLWGRTGCRSNGQGGIHCDTGDCGPTVQCSGRTGEPPATLAEWTFNDAVGGVDWYDISNVDGFNIPVAMYPVRGTYVVHNPDDPFECRSGTCPFDINTGCPSELQLRNSSGSVVGCYSACAKWTNPEYCCPCDGSPCGTGGCKYGCPQTCKASGYANKFKSMCPWAYSYAYDDMKSTFICGSGKTQGPSYVIEFCPRA